MIYPKSKVSVSALTVTTEITAEPRAWIVTKQGMTGDLYEALAWDNGGKPLGVSLSTPTPLYEGEALRAKLTKLGDLLAVIHRDGGHYQAEHGTAKAIEDAIAAVHALRAANGDLQSGVKDYRYTIDGEKLTLAEIIARCPAVDPKVTQRRVERYGWRTMAALQAKPVRLMGNATRRRA